MSAFLGGICIGVTLMVLFIMLGYCWAFAHLTAEDASSLVIDGEVCDGDE
jgi:hypothetical protein